MKLLSTLFAFLVLACFLLFINSLLYQWWLGIFLSLPFGACFFIASCRCYTWKAKPTLYPLYPRHMKTDQRKYRDVKL